MNAGIDDRSAAHALLPDMIANYKKSSRYKNMGTKTLADIVNWVKAGGLDVPVFPPPKHGRVCPHCGKAL